MKRHDHFFPIKGSRFTLDINPDPPFLADTYFVTAHYTDCEFPGCESDVVAGTSFEIY